MLYYKYLAWFLTIYSFPHSFVWFLVHYSCKHRSIDNMKHDPQDNHSFFSKRSGLSSWVLLQYEGLLVSLFCSRVIMKYYDPKDMHSFSWHILSLIYYTFVRFLTRVIGLSPFERFWFQPSWLELACPILITRLELFLEVKALDIKIFCEAISISQVGEALSDGASQSKAKSQKFHWDMRWSKRSRQGTCSSNGMSWSLPSPNLLVQNSKLTSLLT
jgi:hypothetical protein